MHRVGYHCDVGSENLRSLSVIKVEFQDSERLGATLVSADGLEKFLWDLATGAREDQVATGARKDQVAGEHFAFAEAGIGMKARALRVPASAPAHNASRTHAVTSCHGLEVETHMDMRLKRLNACCHLRSCRRSWSQTRRRCQTDTLATH